MKAQNLVLAAVASYAGVGEAAICWTNGLNLLMGGKPWGAGCNTPPVNPPPPPPPVTSTVTSTSTVYSINPATAAAATGVCMGLNPPRPTPLFDSSGNPACCVPIYAGGQQVC
ncbi:hypothetical protein F5144DRAFT_545827 [Chaetomium tenue]|uniref:Uncharacterized protein n=1 Tax=Chaetomium tenue TaxID=1854479 RepID=A0ACB7PM95_9PEZI|nr:hypothetical protein F5144DRAFT_545827 [Chaetomium globosum]